MQSLHYMQMKEQEELYSLLNKGLLFKLYTDCFKDPPYEEDFKESEINSIFLKYLKEGVLLFCYNDNMENVIGFAVAIPLKYEKEIAYLAQNHGCDPSIDWYYADVGVAKEFRGNGICKYLATEFIKLIPANRIIMRTQEKNAASLACHKKIGFEIIDGMYQVIQKPRISGIEEEDKRIFQCYNKDVKGE